MPLNCPSEPELTSFVLGEPSGRTDVASHLAGCAACRDRIRALARLAGAIEASSSAAVAGEGECLDDMALAEFLGAGEEAELRAKRTAHLAECGRCRQQLASLVEVLDDPGVAAEVRRLERAPASWRSRRSQFAAAGLAAAALLLAVGLPLVVKRETPLERDPTITAASAPVPLAPLGDVSAAAALRWTPVSGADRYRVTLFDESGRVQYEMQISDTVVVLPDSIGLVAGRSYLWKVEARTDLERWASSPLIEFRVRRARSP